MRDDPKFEKYPVNCLICNDGFEWQYLGSHVSHKHKISAKKYKEMFRLPHNLSLFNDEVKEKKQKAFNQHRKKYLKNLVISHRFIKGNCGRNRGYISKLEKKNLINRCNEKTISGICPVCNASFDHLQSHLFNKHKLLFVGD
jgi:hypothetical protein